MALLCLLTQVLGTIAPPALLWATTTDAECTCMTGTHAMCPMHHRSRTGCAMRAAADDGTAMLAPLTVVAPMPLRMSVTILVPASTRAEAFTLGRASHYSVLPDPPPPRA